MQNRGHSCSNSSSGSSSGQQRGRPRSLNIKTENPTRMNRSDRQRPRSVVVRNEFPRDCELPQGKGRFLRFVLFRSFSLDSTPQLVRCRWRGYRRQWRRRQRITQEAKHPTGRAVAESGCLASRRSCRSWGSFRHSAGGRGATESISLNGTVTSPVAL